VRSNLWLLLGAMLRSIRQIARRSFSTAAAAERVKGKLYLKFSSPYQTVYDDKPVHLVNISTLTGVMGIHAEHVPTIAQMRPGVVMVQEDETGSNVKKFFVPAGFTIINDDSTASISASEVMSLDELDFAKAKSALPEYQAKVNSLPDGKDKAEAQIALEVIEAITFAETA